MINIDTNVLIRAYMGDDTQQSPAAQLLMTQASHEGQLFISSYALLEMVWVLKGQKYSRQEIYEALSTLIDAGGIVVGQRSVVLAALERYAKGSADFGDYMIMAEGESQGAHKIASFDKALLKESKQAFMPQYR